MKRGSSMINVGIIGATGYAGGELVRILMNHKDVCIKWYGSRNYIDKKYYQVYRNMFEIEEDISNFGLKLNFEPDSETSALAIFTETPSSPE